MINAAYIFLTFLLLSSTSCNNPEERYKAQNPRIIIHATAADAHLAALVEAAAIEGQWYVCTGKSMEPLIVGEMYVVALRVPFATLKEGDVVNYRPNWTGNRLVVHRLIQKEKKGWIASGDNNRWSESWELVTPATYQDKVVSLHGFIIK